MELKLNSAYTVECGIIIPRSHLKDDKAERYAVFDVLTTETNTSYTKKTRTFSTSLRHRQTAHNKIHLSLPLSVLRSSFMFIICLPVADIMVLFTFSTQPFSVRT